MRFVESISKGCRISFVFEASSPCTILLRPYTKLVASVRRDRVSNVANMLASTPFRRVFSFVDAIASSSFKNVHQHLCFRGLLSLLDAIASPNNLSLLKHVYFYDWYSFSEVHNSRILFGYFFADEMQPL